MSSSFCAANLPGTPISPAGGARADLETVTTLIDTDAAAPTVMYVSDDLLLEVFKILFGPIDNPYKFLYSTAGHVASTCRILNSFFWREAPRLIQPRLMPLQLSLIVTAAELARCLAGPENEIPTLAHLKHALQTSRLPGRVAMSWHLALRLKAANLAAQVYIPDDELKYWLAERSKFHGFFVETFGEAVANSEIDVVSSKDKAHPGRLLIAADMNIPTVLNFKSRDAVAVRSSVWQPHGEFVSYPVAWLDLSEIHWRIQMQHPHQVPHELYKLCCSQFKVLRVSLAIELQADCVLTFSKKRASWPHLRWHQIPNRILVWTLCYDETKAVPSLGIMINHLLASLRFHIRPDTQVFVASIYPADEVICRMRYGQPVVFGKPTFGYPFPEQEVRIDTGIPRLETRFTYTFRKGFVAGIFTRPPAEDDLVLAPAPAVSPSALVLEKKGEIFLLFYRVMGASVFLEWFEINTAQRSMKQAPNWGSSSELLCRFHELTGVEWHFHESAVQRGRTAGEYRFIGQVGQCRQQVIEAFEAGKSRRDSSPKRN